MKRWCLIFSILAFLLGSTLLPAQTAADEPISLINGSFEDVPQHSRQPSGWHDCGFAGESAPDTQPNNEFAVSKPAAHGATYIGMVVRDNDTYESVSQRLSQPLRSGECYEFSIMLARSEMYVSLSRLTEEVVNYNTPAKLRIYGGFGHCDRRELLGESELVTNFDWAENRFKLEPASNYTYLILEAYYDTPVLFPYNGNILMDQASALVPMGCAAPLPDPAEETVVANEPPAQQPEAPASADPTRGGQPAMQPARPESQPPAQPATTPQPASPAPTTIAELNRSNIRKGQTLQMDKLFFEADKAIIRSGSEEALEELFAFLQDNPDVVIEVGGHTNGLPPDDYCDRLSTDRAKTITTHLRRRGIPAQQLQYKGYGKRYPIASNETVEGRRKNQRVEIKILSVGNQTN